MKFDLEFDLKFEISDGKNLVKLWGEDFSTCQESTKHFGANFGENFCARPLPEDLGDEILHFYPHPPA